MAIRKPRPQAAQFFVYGKEESNFIDALRAQTLGRHDLCSDDSLCIAGATTENSVFVFTGENMRRHRIHVRRQHDPRQRIGRGNYVETILVDFLQA